MQKNKQIEELTIRRNLLKEIINCEKVVISENELIEDNKIYEALKLIYQEILSLKEFDKESFEKVFNIENKIYKQVRIKSQILNTIVEYHKKLDNSYIKKGKAKVLLGEIEDKINEIGLENKKELLEKIKSPNIAIKSKIEFVLPLIFINLKTEISAEWKTKLDEIFINKKKVFWISFVLLILTLSPVAYKVYDSFIEKEVETTEKTEKFDYSVFDKWEGKWFTHEGGGTELYSELKLKRLDSILKSSYKNRDSDVLQLVANLDSNSNVLKGVFFKENDSTGYNGTFNFKMSEKEDSFKGFYTFKGKSNFWDGSRKKYTIPDTVPPKSKIAVQRVKVIDAKTLKPIPDYVVEIIIDTSYKATTNDRGIAEFRIDTAVIGFNPNNTYKIFDNNCYLFINEITINISTNE